MPLYGAHAGGQGLAKVQSDSTTGSALISFHNSTTHKGYFGWNNDHINIQSEGGIPIVLQGGNVGIGTTSPRAPLHIVGVTPQPGFVYTVESGASAGAEVAFTSNNGFGSMSLSNTSGFGISFNNTTGGWYIEANTNINLMPSGNVGIGTTSPTAKLHVIGDFTATGVKAALVETDSFGKRRLYAIESPENWFEDFGSAKLIEGQAIIRLDPIFAETVNTKEEYHVFLTPKGDCEGLYVANQTPTFFEVKELKKGKSNIVFGYRIVAKRKGYEKVRLAKVEEINQETQVAEVGK